MYEFIYGYLIITAIVFSLIDFKISMFLNMGIAPSKEIKEIEELLSNNRIRYISEIFASLFWPYLLFKILKFKEEI